MAVAFKGGGASVGSATETSGAALQPICPATVDAGDILIAHVFHEGTATAPTTPTGWTLLHGPEVIQSTIARHWVFGKIADGAEDSATVDFGTAGGTNQRGATVYSFSGRVSGAITDLCPAASFSATSHATDPQMPSVTTTETAALAVALVAQNDNNAQAAATGESGGDWVEATAEFAVALTPGLALGLQTCTPTANPGTVSGGSISTANDPCGVIGFEIRTQPAGPTMVSATRAVTYDVRNVVSATRAVPYDVRNTAAATRAVPYDVRNGVSATRAVVYDVVANVVAQRAVVYDVRNFASATRAVAFDIRNLTSATRAVQYDVWVWTSATRAVVYDVDGAVLIVVRQIGKRRHGVRIT